MSTSTSEQTSSNVSSQVNTNNEQQVNATPRVVTIRLQSEAKKKKKERNVKWTNDVKDNDNQKTSKKCCIFHRKKEFGESDSESDSDSDDEHDCHKHHHHHHDHEHNCDH